MNRVVHFEIQADEPERAAQFYRNVFGWDIQKWPGSDMEYWMVMTAPKESTEPGINGGLLKRPAPMTAEDGSKICGVNSFVCTVQVDNYDQIAAKILSSGGIVAVPKFALAGMAWQGYFLDTEGNTFGLHQTDPGAK
jgi:predicted enzyme related to lactoylglutathione lyase